MKKLTIAKLLLVTQTDLARVVDLGPDGGALVELVLAADSERRLVLCRRPAQVDASLKTGVHLLEN